jgi:hypothetical protein
VLTITSNEKKSLSATAGSAWFQVEKGLKKEFKKFKEFKERSQKSGDAG